MITPSHDIGASGAATKDRYSSTHEVVDTAVGPRRHAHIESPASRYSIAASDHTVAQLGTATSCQIPTSPYCSRNSAEHSFKQGHTSSAQDASFNSNKFLTYHSYIHPSSSSSSSQMRSTPLRSYAVPCNRTSIPSSGCRIRSTQSTTRPRIHLHVHLRIHSQSHLRIFISMHTTEHSQSRRHSSQKSQDLYTSLVCSASSLGGPESSR